MWYQAQTRALYGLILSAFFVIVLALPGKLAAASYTLNFNSTSDFPSPSLVSRYCAQATIFTLTTLNPKVETGAFRFQGTDDCAGNDSNVYYKITDVSIPIVENTVLEYKIAPQNTFGQNVAVDLLLDNGTYLRNQNIYSSDVVLMNPAY